MLSFHFLSFHEDFKDGNPKYKGGNVKGGRLITLFWMNKALRIGIDHWTLEVSILNSCLVLKHVDNDLGIVQRWEFWEKDFHF